MAKTDMIRARIEPGLKKQVEGLLTGIGLTHSDFVGIMYRQAAKEKKLPITVTPFREWLEGLPVSKNVPNAETVRAMTSKRGKRYASFEEFKRAMNPPDAS